MMGSYLSVQLPLHYEYSKIQYSIYIPAYNCNDATVNLNIYCKENPKIPRHLCLGQQFTPNLKQAVHNFLAQKYRLRLDSHPSCFTLNKAAQCMLEITV